MDPQVLVCRTSLEYASSLLELRALQRKHKARVVPLFSERVEEDVVRRALAPPLSGTLYRPTNATASLSKIDARATLRQLEVVAREGASKSGAVCVVLENDPFALFGAAHAILARKKLVVLPRMSSLATSEALRGVPSLTLVVSTLALVALGIDPLRRIVSTLGIRRFGVLTASTGARLSNLVARIALRTPTRVRRGSIFEVGKSDAPALAALKNVALPTHPSAELERLGTLKGALPFAVFVGHGRSYCGLAGNLCSRTVPATATDPTCIRDYTCVFQGAPRTPARNLHVDFAFTDSCSTLSFKLIGPELDTGMNLGVHLTDGHACAVIGPNDTNAVRTMSPYFLWNLLDRGTTMGEACARLGDLAAERNGTLPPYLLLGDPEMTLFEVARKGDALLDASVVATEEDEATLRIPVRPGQVVTYRSNSPALRELTAESDVIHGVLERSLYERALVEVLPSSGARHTDVLVVWSKHVKQRSSELWLTKRAPFRHEIMQMAGEMSENARFEQRWLGGPRREELAALLLDIENPVISLHGGPVNEPLHYATLRELERDVIDACDRVGQEMMSNILLASWSRNVWPRNHYGSVHGVFALAEHRSPKSTICPRCKALARELPYHVGLWPRRERRLLECESCMFLYDVEGTHVPILLEAPDEVDVQTPFAIEMRVTNALSYPAFAHAAVAFDRISNPREVFGIAPETQSMLLAPGEERTISFRVVLGKGITPHMFHAKGLVFLNGALSWTMRKVRVRAPSRLKGGSSRARKT